MRRNLLGLFTIIWIVSLGFIGCSDSSSDDDYTTYKAEVGVISNSTYDAAMTKISYWNDFTYSNVASLRLYLYNNTLSDHEIQTGITLEEIRDFLLSKGFSNYEVSNEIDLLKKVGNDIAFFEHATDSSKKVWMYVTK